MRVLEKVRKRLMGGEEVISELAYVRYDTTGNVRINVTLKRVATFVALQVL
jgi:hypothetical protein